MSQKIGPTEVTTQRKKPASSSNYVARPTISPNGGTFTPSVEVTLTCATAGATVHVTTDGSRPSTASPVYTVPFTINVVGTTRVRAFAVKTGKNDSAYAAADFNITATIETVATPLITPSSGTFESSVSVTIACATSLAVVRYTTDGSTPTEFSTVYSVPFNITVTGTVRAKGLKSGMNDSAVASEAYTITAPPPPPPPPVETVGTPTISPNGGSFVTSVQISMATATSGATLIYTLDGGSPIIYSGPFTIFINRVVRVQGTKEGMHGSAVTTATFTITEAPPPPPGPNEYVVPLSIDSTGASEVTAELQDWLDNTVPNTNAVVIFQEGGIYNCEFPLQLFDKTGWTIRGENATMQANEKGMSVDTDEFFVGNGVTMQWDVVNNIDLPPIVRINGGAREVVANVNKMTQHTAAFYYEQNGNTIYRDTLLAPLTGAETLSVRYNYRTVDLANIPTYLEAVNYLTSWPRQRQHLNPIYCTGLHIKDFNIVGPKLPADPFDAAVEGQHAYEFLGCVSNFLENCTATGVWGDALDFRGGTRAVSDGGVQGQVLPDDPLLGFPALIFGSGHWCVDMHVAGCTFQNLGRQGIVPLAAQDLLIEYSTFSNIKRSWIDIEMISNYQALLRFTVRNCVANQIGNTFFTNGAYSHMVDGVVLEDISTDGVMSMLVPNGKLRPNYGYIDTGGGVRERLAYGMARRGSYTFRRCIQTGGGSNGSGRPIVRAAGAAYITVKDCVANIQAPRDTFVEASVNATIDVSGNSGQGIVNQYETVPDPSIGDGLFEGYILDANNLPTTEFRSEQYFGDFPMPSQAPIQPPFPL